jgi:hypothetical protein
MFDAAQWSGVTFFTPVVGSAKDFSVASGSECSGSLADTASERDDVRSIKSDISLPLHSVHSRPRSSLSLSLAHDQKRQKIFDYIQEGRLLATKEAPKLQDLGPEI